MKLLAVNCRIGSLEKLHCQKATAQAVNCRIGSLERPKTLFEALVYVNCRVGSLEIYYPNC